MISLFGIPLDYNSSHLRGPAEAPGRIRAALASGSMNSYSEELVDIADPNVLEDLGDVDCAVPDTGFTAITHFAGELLKNGRKTLALGGDHSVTFPLLLAVHAQHGPVTILHFDAHPDLYDNFEGNPYSHASPFARIMEKELANRLIQIGIRTINNHQAEQISRFGVDVIEARHFDMDKVRALKIEGPLYISIDLDALDPAYAPGVSHHEPGGLTTRNIIDVLQSLKCEIVGGDIVELNPRQDRDDISAYVAVKLLKELAAIMT